MEPDVPPSTVIEMTGGESPPPPQLASRTTQPRMIARLMGVKIVFVSVPWLIGCHRIDVHRIRVRSDRIWVRQPICGGQKVRAA